MGQRLDACLAPPNPLVTMSVNLAMMQAAYRHGELVAHLETQRARLGKAQVVRIARAAAAHKTRLVRYKAAVLLVPQPGCFLRRPPARDGRLLDRCGLANLL